MYVKLPSLSVAPVSPLRPRTERSATVSSLLLHARVHLSPAALLFATLPGSQTCQAAVISTCRERGECVQDSECESASESSANSSTVSAPCSVMTLEAIRYRAGSLQILNQLLLPHQTVYDELRSVQDAYEAIKSMKVRELPSLSPSPIRHAFIPAVRPFSFPPVVRLLCFTKCPPPCSCHRPLFLFCSCPQNPLLSTPLLRTFVLHVSFHITTFRRVKVVACIHPPMKHAPSSTFFGRDY